MLNSNTVASNSQALAREPVNLHRVNLKTFIESLEGKIAAIDFTKLGGFHRTLVGRLGVKAPLKGGINKVEKCDRSYLTIYDMQAKGYRTVNLMTVTEIRANGNTFHIVG